MNLPLGLYHHNYLSPNPDQPLARMNHTNYHNNGHASVSGCSASENWLRNERFVFRSSTTINTWKSHLQSNNPGSDDERKIRVGHLSAYTLQEITSCFPCIPVQEWPKRRNFVRPLCRNKEGPWKSFRWWITHDISFKMWGHPHNSAPCLFHLTTCRLLCGSRWWRYGRYLQLFDLKVQRSVDTRYHVDGNLRWTHQDHQFWRVADNLFLMHFRWTQRRGLIHATTKSLEWGVLQGHQVEGLKWYTYHCRPSLAMIVDLFVLPGLCFQSLSTFYRSLVYGLCVWNTNKRIKCTVGSKYGLWCEHAQWRLQNL